MKYLANYLIIFGGVFIIFLSDSLASSKTPVVVDVVGYADVVEGKKEKARENALNSAFHLAVEQVVGVMISSKTVVQDFQLINDKILSRSSGFIKTYKITGETFEADSCRINVRATVSASHLEKGLGDAGLLSTKLGKPRLALIMTEQNIGNDSPTSSLQDASVNASIAETIIHGILEKKGYSLVDRETLVAIARQEGVISAADATVPVNAAIQVAAGGGAEVVVIGQSIAKAGGTVVSGTNMRTSQAQVSAKVVDADTGLIIASYSASGSVAHVNPTAGGADAIKKASREVANNLNKQILAKWNRKAGGTRTAKVTVKGIEFEDISRLRDLMKERLSHVEETLERGYKDGNLSLEVEINGTPHELAEEINATGMDDFSCKVLSYSGNTLSLQLHKK